MEKVRTSNIGGSTKSVYSSSAYSVFQKNELGKIEAGRLAVLDRNQCKVPAEEILKTEVEIMLLDGEVVWEKHLHCFEIKNCSFSEGTTRIW